jgi:hypothetical protein
MANKDIASSEKQSPEQPPKILTKPLPIILDEMEGNIKAAAEAARKAEEAAKKAGQAAVSEFKPRRR